MNKVTIERIKNVMIVVLLMSAILLLSFFWRGISLEGLKSLSLSVTGTGDVPKASELVRPEYIRTGTGSDSYVLNDTTYNLPENTVSGAEDDSVYSGLKCILGEYLNSSNISVESIEKKQYEEVMSYATISAVFSYEMPFAQYLRDNELKVFQGATSIDMMTTITFSPFSSGNVFICDETEGKYYRIATRDDAFAKEKAEQLSDLISTISGSADSTYYTIKSVAGSDNSALIPISMYSTLKEQSYDTEFEINDPADVESMESVFFSKGMDFVRKITENKGSLLYVFGFSEKVLQLNEDGKISYSEEFDSSTYEEQNMYETLSTAIDYVSNHGGWKDITAGDAEPYLRSVEKIKQDNDNYTGYRFVFGAKIAGIPEEYSDGSVITIDVYGKQVTYYVRDVIETSSAETAESWQASAPMDLITSNYPMMYNVIKASEQSTAGSVPESSDQSSAASEAASQSAGSPSEDEFDYVMGSIGKVELCMYRARGDSGSLLIPSWMITTDHADFWFDARNGEFEYYVIRR